MINHTKALKLVKIYSIICDRFEKDLKYTCQRFSNNQKHDLTYQEIMTIYLFAIQEEQRFSLKQIPNFACDYLRSYFPNLFTFLLSKFRFLFRFFVSIESIA
jgi:hypothetical protein